MKMLETTIQTRTVIEQRVSHEGSEFVFEVSWAPETRWSLLGDSTLRIFRRTKDGLVEIPQMGMVTADWDTMSPLTLEMCVLILDQIGATP